MTTPCKRESHKRRWHNGHKGELLHWPVVSTHCVISPRGMIRCRMLKYYR